VASKRVRVCRREGKNKHYVVHVPGQNKNKGVLLYANRKKKDVIVGGQAVYRSRRKKTGGPVGRGLVQTNVGNRIVIKTMIANKWGLIWQAVTGTEVSGNGTQVVKRSGTGLKLNGTQ